jgi:hypothetical protein
LLPEFQAGLIFGINPGVSLVNALSCRAGQTLFDELPTDAAMTKVAGNRQMVQIRAAAVVPAKHGPHQSAVLPHDDAQAGIVFQVGRRSFSRISVGQTDTRRVLPQRKNFVVVVHRHLGQDV